jgi:hypothetical protein
MPGDKFESFTSLSGEPIFRFLTGASFELRQFGDIPYECCVFKIDHVTKVMAVSRYGDKDEWHANSGERSIINELLRRAAESVEEKITPTNTGIAFASQMPCSPCTASRGVQDCNGIFGSSSCAECLTRHFAHIIGGAK